MRGVAGASLVRARCAEYEILRVACQALTRAAGKWHRVPVGLLRVVRDKRFSTQAALLSAVRA